MEIEQVEDLNCNLDVQRPDFTFFSRVCVFPIANQLKTVFYFDNVAIASLCNVLLPFWIRCFRLAGVRVNVIEGKSGGK